MGPQIGVVIPASQGERTLGSVLDALACQRTDRTVDVVVVVNGSRDDTARVAADGARRLSAAGHICRVAESSPGRAHAIRLGESLLSPGIRVYLDCDALLSENAIEEFARALSPGSGVHFAAPRLELARSPSLATRCFFRTWQALPYVSDSPVTCGVYGLSEEGRARWGQMPVIHSDDKLARLHFARRERRLLEDATYSVEAPLGFGELVAARVRYLAGNRELAAIAPLLVTADLNRYRGVLRTVLRRPSLWPSTAVFALVYACALVRDGWTNPRGRNKAGPELEPDNYASIAA